RRSEVRAPELSPDQPSARKNTYPPPPQVPESLRFLLSFEFLQGFLGFFYVLERQLPGFDQVRHHRLRPAPKQREQIVDQPPLRRLPRYHGLENMRVADLFDAPKRILALKAIHRGLDGCVRRFVTLRKRFLDLADRERSPLPQRL